MKTSLLLLVVVCLQDDAALKSFDAPMELQIRQKTPGGALAVAKDGRLVYAKGFGLGDVVNNAPVEATSLFRIASLSKPITAVAILKLAQDGKDRKSTRLNSSHLKLSRMPSSA